VDRAGGSASIIDGNDLTMVTSNWNMPQALPFQSGDANGDRKINEADLALVGSNFATTEPVRAHHLIYSLPRDDYAFQNSRLWSGGMNSTFVRRLVSGTGRDYWPAVSPEGARIAFVRNVGTNGTDKFALFVAPLTNGVAGVAKRITPPGDAYDAFAPAWSPDGSQLAFVCSYDRAWFDGSSPAGHLCLIDGSGRNFRLPIEANLKRPLPVKVQSPSWMNSQIVFFAYDKEPGIASAFDNRVAFLTLPNYVMSGSSNVPTNSDQPAFRNTVMGPTLLYRFDDGAGSRTLRFAQTNTTGGVPGSYPNVTPGTLHGDVGGSSQVDYFTVSTGADPNVFFYTSNPATGSAGGNTFFIRVFGGTATAPIWFPVTVVSYGVSNGLGNLEFTSPFHDVLRNTAAFVP
jgi:hypothetical protein